MEDLQRKSLAQQVAERLMTRITSGLIEPGQRLPSERNLSSALNVTRTTIREAIKILQGLRLVTVRHGDGVRVQDFLRNASMDVLGELLFIDGQVNANALDQILEARALYGGMVATLAAQRRTEEDIEQYEALVQKIEGLDAKELQKIDLEIFHCVALASKNMVFLFVLNATTSIYERHEEAFLPAYQDVGAVYQAHKAVFDAIRDQDAKKAAKMMQEMLEEQRTILMEVHNGKEK